MALGLTSASRGTGGRKKRRKKATTKRRRTTKRRGYGSGTNAAGRRWLRKSGIPRQKGPAYDTEGMLTARPRRKKRGGRLVKGSAAAKARMAQLRRMRRR